MIYVSRRCRFSASFNDEEGLFYGHNFNLWVTITGTKDLKTGMICHLTELKELMDAFIEKWDHSHLPTTFIANLEDSAKPIQFMLAKKHIKLDALSLSLPHGEQLNWSPYMMKTGPSIKHSKTFTKKIKPAIKKESLNASNLPVPVKGLKQISIQTTANAGGQIGAQPEGQIVELFKGVEFGFYAGHCLQSPELDATKNKDLYGICAEKHGHTFTLRLLQKVDSSKAQPIDILEDTVLLTWLQSLQNAWLNDVFPVQPCTGENMVEWMGKTYGVVLDVIDLQETENNRFIWKKHENINYFGY